MTQRQRGNLLAPAQQVRVATDDDSDGPLLDGVRQCLLDLVLRGPHSINSSAMEISVGGTVRPSARAVLRLIASSNFVGRSTGSSAGLALCRIRCTYQALRLKKCDKGAPYDMSPPTPTGSLDWYIAGKWCRSKSIICPMCCCIRISLVVTNAFG